MKYLLIAVSFLFATASAGEDISGYTGSVVSEKDFELPYNPFSGKIETYTFNDEKPHIELVNHLYGFDQPLESCFSDKNPSQNCFIPFPDDAKEFCSDKHNKKSYLCKFSKENAKTPVAYISIKENQSISIKAHLSYKINKKYCLALHKYNDNEDKGSFLYARIIDNDQSSEEIPYDIIKDGGIFKIYPHNSEIQNEKNDKKCNPQTDNKQAILAFQVLPYKEITKNIVYVELNGDPKDPWKPDNTSCENGFTEGCVNTILKEVYNQAVIDVKTNPESSDDFHRSSLIDVWMTNPDGSSYTYETIKKKVEDIIKEPEVAQNKDSKYWHFVIAINKVRKLWELGKCVSAESKETGKITDITNCGIYGFRPENEHKDTHYFIYNRITGNITSKKEAKIRVKQRIEDNKPKMQYYVFTKEDPNGQYEHHPYKNGDILFTDDGYPVIPKKECITGSTLAFSDPLASNDKHDGYLAYGSLILVPRRTGKSGLYTLMHELGHSFGLTDVSVSNVYKTTETAIYATNNENDHGLFVNENSTNLGEREYNNKYASTESNIMSWKFPTGNKLRYRPVPIACTGGTKYYKATMEKKDEDGNIYTGYDDEKGTWGTSIERLILDGIKDKNNIEDKDWQELNQWECIRGNCYNSKYSSTYSTNARKTYYERSNEESWCYANKKIEANKNTKNQVTDEATYKADYDKIMSVKYEEKK